MRDFLSSHGLWAAFVLALIENDVAFIAIGVVAKLGDNNPTTPNLNLFAVIPAAIVGAIIHDSIWFFLGYLHSDTIKSSRVYRRIGPTVERWAKRFGLWEIFLARFIYGTRNPSSAFWGVQRLPWIKFAGIELLSLCIWGGILVAIGYHSTAWAMKFLGKVESKNQPYLLFIAVVAAFVLIALLRIFNRKGIVKIQARVERREHTAEAALNDPKSPADAGTR